MATKKRIKKGDLVNILTGTKLDKILKDKNASFVGTVLECRYKTDAYLVFPANGPFIFEPYWTEGYRLEVAH